MAPPPAEIAETAETDLRDTTFVTANRRLAAVVRSSLDRARLDAGRPVWESPDVVPFTAWIERWWERTLVSGGAPAVLGPEQEQALWEQVIADDLARAGNLPAPRLGAAAREARRARTLASDWLVSSADFDDPASTDVRAFCRWARRVRERCADEGWTTAADAAEALASHRDTVLPPGPGQVVFLGFERLTPLHRRLVARLRGGGARVRTAHGGRSRAAGTRVMCPDAEAELEMAARWACGVLEGGGSGLLGVVVPDLEQRRHQVESTFDSVLQPGVSVPGASPSVPPYNISLGLPLASYPVVRDALAVVALAGGRIELDVACRLLRSPFIGAASGEASLRACLEARLRARAEVLAGVESFHRWAARVEVTDLAGRLDRAGVHLRGVPASQRTHGWSETFATMLEILDWPGARSLSSAEFQTVQAFRELLASFSSLSAFAGQLPADTAVARLHRLARERVFQPRASPARVQILGVLESLGLGFDELWLLGLHDGAWPTPARPNPFLPLALQRRLGMPRADARTELDYCRRLIRRWRSSARSVTASSPARAADQALQPSPLVAAWPLRTGLGRELSSVPTWRVLIRDQSPGMAYQSDASGPVAEDSGIVPGGGRVLQDQAACPFRGFAIHRLGAAGIRAATTTLDAAVQGELAHRALAHLWRGLRSRDRLLALGSVEREASILEAVERALDEESRRRPQPLGGRLRALERQRLGGLLEEWLGLEGERSPFEVLAIEQATQVRVGPLRLRVRPDRIDRLPDGRRVLIDYKTGGGTISGWFGDRPSEPQLPLYVLAGEQGGAQGGGYAAAALAVLRRGQVRCRGLSEEDGLAPGVGRPESSRTPAARSAGAWSEVKRRWGGVLVRLARDWAGGNARIDPVLGLRTCRSCPVQPLCRVREHARAFAVPDED